MEKIVFLDRDGTINIEKNYLYSIEDFQFIQGTPEAICMLNKYNYRVIVVSNQAGIARGYYTESDVEKLHKFINTELNKYGAHIDQFFYCPHHPDGIGKYKKICNCRKPAIGMLSKAGYIYDIDKDNSWMIGDTKNDILAGKRYNIKTALVATGYGKKVYDQEGQNINFDYFAKNILDAVNFIINNDKSLKKE